MEDPMTVRYTAFALLVGSALLVATTHPGRGQEKSSPIAARVKAELKDPSKPFTMLVRIAVKEGTAEKLEAAVKPAVAASIKDKGCLHYAVYREVGGPNRYLVYERWQDFDSLAAHLETPHIRELLDSVRDLLAAPPEVKVMPG